MDISVMAWDMNKNMASKYDQCYRFFLNIGYPMVAQTNTGNNNIRFH